VINWHAFALKGWMRRSCPVGCANAEV